MNASTKLKTVHAFLISIIVVLAFLPGLG